MKTLAALILVFCAGTAFCQFPNVLIGNIGNPEEPSIYINPKNTNQLIAGANIDKYYLSNDGGITWTAHTISSTLEVAGDPCMIIDTAGNYYYFHLSSPINSYWLDRIVCQKSTDQGATWNDGSGTQVIEPKQQDKPWAVVNPWNNEIYLTWTQFDEYGVSDQDKFTKILFSKSTDTGETWSEPVAINEIDGNCVDSDSTVEGAVPAVGPNGEIYVSWAGPAGLVFDRSSDGGNSWLDHDIFVSDLPGGWDINIPGVVRCDGMPVTCCDLSQSPYHGTIYINWSDQRNGTDDTDIWVVKSTDSGNTWSAPKRVNDDQPGNQQFFTWMTIDQANGTLWFVFYDRRNYTDNQTDVYLAYSNDGGETFTNIKISESPFTNKTNVFFGDYINITAYNNIVRPIWTRQENNKTFVYTAIMDTLFMDLGNHPEAPFSVVGNYPNPFTDVSFISFKLRKETTISLSVYDLLGKKVYTLINNKVMPAGKYTETFDRNVMHLKAGIYFYRLSGNKLDRTGKIIIN